MIVSWRVAHTPSMYRMKELDEAYEQCRLIAKVQAKNFYYAFMTLPAKKRRAVYAAYSFCRLCDDAADEDFPTDDKLKQLEELRRDLAGCYSGYPNGPVFTALADAADSFQIPECYFQDLISGVETDLTKNRYQDFDELRCYCYGVASAVGLICIHIFGFSDDQAKDHAIDLGLAMQLTNVLRDVKEDLERGRVYLPLDEMEEFGYSLAELQAGETNQAFRGLMSFQASRAREHFNRGFKLLPLLSPRSRGCPAVLGQLYSRILDRIEAKDYNVFSGRISLSKREKYLVTAQTWMRSLLPVGQTLK